jgi:hypothetical protein
MQSHVSISFIELATGACYSQESPVFRKTINKVKISSAFSGETTKVDEENQSKNKFSAVSYLLLT